MRLSAKQIVNNLLEYGVDPDMPAPGSPEDPWRQTTGPEGAMEFAPRPGQPAGDDLGGPPPTPQPRDAALDMLLDKPPGIEGPVPIKSNPRFRWKPPTPPGP